MKQTLIGLIMITITAVGFYLVARNRYKCPYCARTVKWTDVNCPHCGMVITCTHTPPVTYPPNCVNVAPPRPDIEWTDDFIENLRRLDAHKRGVPAQAPSRSRPLWVTDLAMKTSTLGGTSKPG